MDATRRLGRIGMDELNEKWGNANGCMDGWISECMNGRDGMGWISKWMDG